MTGSPSITPGTPETRPEILALVFGDLPAEARAERIAALLSDPTPLDAVRAAFRGDRLVGGVFAEVQPGRAAVVWPPRLVPGEPSGTAERLLDAVSEHLTSQDVRVAYGLLEPGAERDAAGLSAAGFEPVAELLYLVSLDETFPHAPPPSPLHFEPYCEARQDRLARVVEATYEATLDCPRLNGIRRMEDVLAGYRATGTFSPRRWLLVRHAGEDVGCLLLADHAEQESWELVYMGLVPSARGRGWGGDVARHAQWLARQAGRPRLVLAVDSANGPAVRMYSKLGFHPWDRRQVYLKVFGAA